MLANGVWQFARYRVYSPLIVGGALGRYDSRGVMMHPILVSRSFTCRAHTAS